MSDSTTPVITLELAQGSFRIVTPEAVYQINIMPDDDLENKDFLKQSLPLNQFDKFKTPETKDNLTAETLEYTQNVSQTFFENISNELYSAVGTLARKLSVSVGDLPIEIASHGLSQSDEKLENAKGQLEEIIELTEKASMEIMDLADDMQNNLTEIQSNLKSLNELEFMLLADDEVKKEESVIETEKTDDNNNNKLLLSKLYQNVKELIDFSQTLAAVQLTPEIVPESKEESLNEEFSETKTIVSFDINTIFQTLYELCTNEAVKDHLKIMWEEKDTAFESSVAEESLSELAESVEVEDGYYNFPIPAVLKSLYAASKNEEHKVILKKMNQTANSIFLDSVLPIEGIEKALTENSEIIKEDENINQNEETKTSNNSGLNPQQMVDLITRLESLNLVINDCENNLNVSSRNCSDGYISVRAHDKETLIKTINLSNELIKKTMTHLTDIMVSLSFQDLSGQRIKKIADLINSVQVQLLSLLVSVGSKLKFHQEIPTGAVASDEDVSKTAQNEVDKMMEKVTHPTEDKLEGPDSENRLDQDAVNDLLAELGF